MNTVTVPATFCAPEENVPQPATTAYSLDATILQDPHISDGVSRFLFEHDTETAYFMLELRSGCGAAGDRGVPGDRRIVRW